MSGRSSGVEHNLAKVGVGRSNRLARSIFLEKHRQMRPSIVEGFFCFRLNTYSFLQVSLALSRCTHRPAVIQ